MNEPKDREATWSPVKPSYEESLAVAEILSKKMDAGDITPDEAVRTWRSFRSGWILRGDEVFTPATLSPPASPVSASTGLSDSDRSGGRE